MRECETKMAKFLSCFGNQEILTLYLSVIEEQNDHYVVPLESLVIMFTAQWLKDEIEYSTCNRLDVKLVPREAPILITGFKLHKDAFKNFSVETLPVKVLPLIASRCHLPVAVTEGDRLCVAGLCSVLRSILKHANRENCEQLLGFRRNCLASCSEVSVWTKFCEVDMLNSAATFDPIRQRIELPVDILKFEAHLKEPLRTHNLGKLQHIYQQQLHKQNETNDELQQPSHDYADGSSMTLIDLIIFVCIHTIFSQLPLERCNIHKYFPYVVQWFKRMVNQVEVEFACRSCGLNDIKFFEVDDLHFQLNDTLMQNLNIRCKPKRDDSVQLEAKQECLKRTFERLVSVGITPNYLDRPPFLSRDVLWETMPDFVQPTRGDLPNSRLRRKCDQLRNITAAVCDIIEDGDVIVDFCSGGGHLGILLAYLLPNCQVIMVENKEESITRLLRRLCHLPNTIVYQSNVDYFIGDFDIGVALHACGSATDLVIQKCLDQRAAFVVCPCCYGSIKQTSTISYPRSKRFQSAGITTQDHCIVGHAADQTHENGHKNEQGKHCMGLIDIDRLFRAEEFDYNCVLFTMEPANSTLKNNVLIGQLERHLA